MREKKYKFSDILILAALPYGLGMGNEYILFVLEDLLPNISFYLMASIILILYVCGISLSYIFIKYQLR